MIEMFKVKQLIMVCKEVGILLESGVVLVKSGNDFIDHQTGAIYRPVVDAVRGTVLGFSDAV